ncbi:hypothetical protein GOV10_02935, partial [Candidatus Woesearchaeota archaeon]|nr:hypothetical protein [Candidatus Woesearchaeota archaeon]
MEVKDRIKKDELAALKITTLIRDRLLGLGRYFGQHDDHHRVFLPSENLKKVESYQSGAQRKLAKARKLLKNTPVELMGADDNAANRLLLLEKMSRRVH